MTTADPLIKAQRREFAAQGFLVLRGAVPASAVATACACIDKALAVDRSVGRNREYAEKSYCPDILDAEEILALFEGAPRAAVDALFGRAGLAHLTNVQIALRPPEYRSENGHWGAHIDGFPSAADGIPAKQIGRHTAIVGVFLSRAEQPGMGNLWIWPGSHCPMAQAMRRLDPPQFLAEYGAEALHAAAIEAAVRSADGIESTVEAGDVVLCHPLLAHAVGGNLSVQTRYAAYFRVLHPEDSHTNVAPLTNAGLFFDGIGW